jgi:hypothetical protein
MWQALTLDGRNRWTRDVAPQERVHLRGARIVKRIGTSQFNSVSLEDRLAFYTTETGGLQGGSINRQRFVRSTLAIPGE